MSSLKISFCFVVVVLLLASCVSSKKLTQQSVYFKNISDSMLQKSSADYEPRFQKGDILSINVITPNESSSKLFNRPNTPSTISGTNEMSSAGGNASSPGYLVDEKGNIILPFLGYVKAAGLSRPELTDTLTGRIRQYIDSAIVAIRLLNYRVTVLGEVAKPGAYNIPSERVTVLDAIGLAGDLTIYGKRNNIRIIRQTGGVRQTATLDLNKGDIFGSPFFYLRQNDVVYVEMNDRKIPNSDQTSLRNVSLALGIISALGVVISTINVLK